MSDKKQLLVILVAMIILLFSAVTWFWLFQPNSGKGRTVEIDITPGTTIAAIADLLVDERLLRCPVSFRLTARLRGVDRELRAGLYEVPDTLSAWTLVELFRRGSHQFRQVTLPEGLTASRITGILARELELDSTLLMELVNDSSFAAELQLGSDNLEGYLFPETYRFFRRQEPRSVLTTLVQHHQEVMARLLEQTPSPNLDRHQLVTLAAIIQGEMRDTTEAWLISSVYHNRLQAGWKLQADPTIQYLLPDGPRRLLTVDLEIDSPYNTYRYRGLPPGPVNNPGEQALAAAIRPSSSEYFFFVADGSGKHLFSRTAAEHTRARETLDRLRRRLGQGQ